MALQPIISLRRVTHVPTFSNLSLLTTSIIEEYTNRHESKTTIFVSSLTRILLSFTPEGIGYADVQKAATVNISTPVHNIK